MDGESDLGYYRAYPSETARETVGEHLIDGEIAEKTMYGGWNPDRDRYLRVNKDGDWVGMDQTTADRLVWDNRTPILKSVGAYADDMPADLTDRVCVMDERSSAARVKAPDPWTGVDLDALFQASGPTIPDPDPGIDRTPATVPWIPESECENQPCHPSIWNGSAMTSTGIGTKPACLGPHWPKKQA